MPRNGSGTFVPPSNSWNPAVGGTTISSTDFAAQLSDLASGLTSSICADGQTPISANLPMSGFNHTGVALGVNANDYARLDQLQQSQVGWLVGAGTANAITASYSPAIASLTDGLLLAFRASGVNTSTTPTFAPNGLTAHTIVKAGGKPLELGDLAGNLAEYFVRYNLANTRWELLNPSQRLRNAFTLFNGSTGSATSSSTKVMQGFGAVWTITPATTGRVRITVVGYTTNTTTGNAKINAAFGTGTAPVSGAALTGTTFSNTDILATSASSGASPAVPFTFIAEASGLTLGTAYWFDSALGSSTGSSTLTYNCVIVEEL